MNEFNSNTNTGGFLPKIPNATGTLVLGILSVICSCCCMYIAPILGIIGLVLGSKGINTYNANPDAYDAKSLSSLKTGRILSIIGIVLSIAFLIFMFATGSFAKNQELMQCIQEGGEMMECFEDIMGQ